MVSCVFGILLVTTRLSVTILAHMSLKKKWEKKKREKKREKLVPSVDGRLREKEEVGEEEEGEEEGETCSLRAALPRFPRAIHRPLDPFAIPAYQVYLGTVWYPVSSGIHSAYHSPRLPARERRGGASSPRGKTRRRLVRTREDKATPHCLLLVWEDEASPSSVREKIRQRLIAFFSCGKTRRRLIPMWGDARYRPVAGGLRIGILLDRHVPLVPGGIDQNGEP
ncbi:hypothetical protein B296_00039611 [Ensete ventricosum]|uniref:Exostosin GT47 domain-containing protein n=1 Tax=Ensete ventricosum TaxID=4639 RepID=A0A426XQT3_ENSVE|nr:hypothetical protein B296_00039611 [Ensete ventricosum]